MPRCALGGDLQQDTIWSGDRHTIRSECSDVERHAERNATGDANRDATPGSERASERWLRQKLVTSAVTPMAAMTATIVTPSATPRIDQNERRTDGSDEGQLSAQASVSFESMSSLPTCRSFLAMLRALTTYYQRPSMSLDELAELATAPS